MKSLALVVGLFALAACAAQPKPIAYSITVVSASVPAEKAPGIPWDNPEPDKGGFLAGVCKVAIVGGAFYVGGPPGAMAAVPATGQCDKFITKGDQTPALPDPSIELVLDDGTVAFPPVRNTANPGIFCETIVTTKSGMPTPIRAPSENSGITSCGAAKPSVTWENSSRPCHWHSPRPAPSTRIMVYLGITSFANR